MSSKTFSFFNLTAIEEALRSRKNFSGDDMYSMEKSDVVEVYLNKHKYIEGK